MFRDWFKAKVKYQVVEVETPRPLGPIDQERRKSVPTLGAHPGFLYLLSDLKLQRQLIESRLKSNRHESLRDVEMLQAGIFWSNWLQNKLDYEVNRTSTPEPKEALQKEQEAFEAISKQLEIIGG